MCDLMIPEDMTEEKWQKEREIFGVKKPSESLLSTAESIATLRASLLSQFEANRQQATEPESPVFH